MTSTKQHVLCVALTSVFACTAYGQTVNRIIHVDADSLATPPDGQSWSTAFKYLQDALQYVRDNPTAPNTWDEIWVANGVYKPNQCTNANSYVCTRRCDGVATDAQHISFCMRNSLRIYGGFNGWESSLADRPFDPDPFTVYPTTDSVLGGDRWGNDAIVSASCPPSGDCSADCAAIIDPGFPPNTWDPLKNECRDAYGLLVTRRTDNSDSVVSGPANLSGNMVDGSAAILDGFSITGGFAQGFGFDVNGNELGGGGIRFLGGAPKVWNCTIKGNRADNGGGAIYVYGAQRFDGHFVNNVIMENYSGHGGGGAAKQEFYPLFVNCYVLGNVSGDRGGAFSFSDPTGQAISEPRIINCVFTRNIAGPIGSGGGASAGIGGAIYASGENTWVHVFNSVIADNKTLKVGSATRQGGGLFFGNLSRGEIANTIVWGNVADEGMQMYVNVPQGKVTVNYSDVRAYPKNG